ncbi:MAG: MraY family glycosyltransferase, partial [Ignavibacteria bacterium]|nr:MraY family glycosyltransferase [Ignavibacteria bacterium]
MIYLIISFLTFLITIVLTPFLIQYLIKKDIVDKPNGEVRRIHTEPIPRMGGIIVFAVILIITFAFYQDIYSKIFFIAGAITAFGLGFIDDIKGVRWQIKFFIQSIAAVLLILSFNADSLTIIKFMGYTLFPGLNYAILFILIVGLLNSFNLMDGLDGLVTGYSLIVASMVFLLSMGTQLTFLEYLSSAIIGTTLGFLKFNANPARIFLGDSGSLTLGYLVSGIVIAISGEVSLNPGSNPHVFSNTIDLTFIFIALAIPLADTIRVLLVRVNKRRH